MTLPITLQHQPSATTRPILLTTEQVRVMDAEEKRKASATPPQREREEPEAHPGFKDSELMNMGRNR